MFAGNLVFTGNRSVTLHNPRVSYDLHWALLYASNHAGLVIYLNKKWEYKLKTDVTESTLWERQIIEIFNPNKTQKK